jgi:2'-5' RNA ligase
MSDDWKNDRAEASMREQEAKNMAKASAEFKAKQTITGEWEITLKAHGENAKQTVKEFIDALAKLQKEFTGDEVTCEVDPITKL